MRAVIRGAAKYLASSCDSAGKFSYLARANGLPHDGRDMYDVTQAFKFLQMLYVLFSYRKHGWALTFENVDSARVGGRGPCAVRLV